MIVKKVLIKTKLAKALVLGCVALFAMLPASARVEEGVDTLVDFTGKNGAQPQSIIEDSNGNFYGTTLSGGKYNKGTVFKILADGQLVTLVDFDGANGSSPEAGLLLGPDGGLYGTTKTGGANNKGSIFKITPDGKFFTLISFDGKNGASPDSGLNLGADGNIYGTTLTGGAADKGTIFEITPKGQLTTLETFNGMNGANPGSLAASDDGSFYGTCSKGGPAGKGLIFNYKPDGHLATVVTFTGPNGAFPVSGLVRGQDGNYYGVTSDGGANNLGTTFKLTPDGKFTLLASFSGPNGAHPGSGLVEWSNGYFYMIRLWQNMQIKSSKVQWSGANFCGTTTGGGLHGQGTVFRVGDDGNLVTLVSFTGSQGIDLGANPNSLIPGLDGNLYGTTGFGGHGGNGTVFRLQLQLFPLPVAGSTKGADAAFHKLSPPVVSP